MFVVIIRLISKGFDIENLTKDLQSLCLTYKGLGLSKENLSRECLVYFIEADTIAVPGSYVEFELRQHPGPFHGLGGYQDRLVEDIKVVIEKYFPGTEIYYHKEGWSKE